MSDESAPTPPPMDDASFSSPTPPPPPEAIGASGGGAGSAPGGLPGPGQGKLSDKDDKLFGMLAHLLGALTSFVGPLVIWLIKKEESPFVDDQGREALNFQITVLIGFVVSFVLSFLPFVGCVTMLLFPAIGIASLIFGILGCVEANKGTAYRYPFALRLIS